MWSAQSHPPSLHIRHEIGREKTTYVARVLEELPSEEVKKNTQLTTMMRETNKDNPLTIVQKIQYNRLKFFGHLVRHPEELQHKICFDKARRIRELNLQLQKQMQVDQQ